MIESKTKLVSTQINTEIIAGVLFTIPDQGNNRITIDKESINFFLEPDYSLASVYSSLMNEYKKISPIGYQLNRFFTRVYYNIGLLSFSFLIVLILGIAEIFGNGIYDILSNGYSNTNEFILVTVLVTTILLLIVIFIVPSLFQADVSAGRKYWDERVRSDSLMEKRIVRVLNRVSKKYPAITDLNIWNPNAFSNKRDTIVKSLIKKVVKSKYRLRVYTRVDERSRTRNIINSFFENRIIWEEEKVILENPNTNIDYFPIDLMTNKELDVLCLLLYCSTLSLDWEMFSKIDTNSPLYATVSVPLAEVIFNKYENKIYSSDDHEYVTLDSYISRFINDYNLFALAFSRNIDNWKLKNIDLFKALRDRVLSEFDFIKQYIQSDTLHLITQLDDPVASILMLNANRSNSLFSINRTASIDHFVDVVSKYELFSSLKVFWDYMVHDSETKKDKDATQNVFRILEISKIKLLVNNFIYSGMYDCTLPKSRNHK